MGGRAREETAKAHRKHLKTDDGDICTRIMRRRYIWRATHKRYEDKPGLGDYNES